ncbi:MAG TPA: helix-turn-helix domain-containing protein [Mobilitalea sp.]|nr:helix-turn-helix domain-containing protein [Mobilitalea sp.]
MSNEVLDNIFTTIDYYNHRICTPTWCIIDQVIDFVDITYVIKGQAEYTINGKKYIISAGELLCIPAGSQRSAISCPDELMECYSLNGFIRNIDGKDITLPLPLISSIGIHKDIVALYNDLNTTWRLRDPGYPLKARAIYLMILQRYFQLIVYQTDTSSLDKRIKKVLYHMSNHYHEPLTVHNMANMVNLSDMYFGNLFKQETSMSFHKFLTSIRMNRAEDMLYSGEYKINEIADACGFSDMFYFSKIFKENRGYSPSSALRSRYDQQ